MQYIKSVILSIAALFGFGTAKAPEVINPPIVAESPISVPASQPIEPTPIHTVKATIKNEKPLPLSKVEQPIKESPSVIVVDISASTTKNDNHIVVSEEERLRQIQIEMGLENDRKIILKKAEEDALAKEKAQDDLVRQAGRTASNIGAINLNIIELKKTYIADQERIMGIYGTEGQKRTQLAELENIYLLDLSKLELELEALLTTK